MALGLCGGLALFLFGMEMMAGALGAVAGGRMRELLGRLTANRIAGALTGAAVTAVIQSSSVTTILVIGFISADLMSLSQAVGVIMGANIGTTVTAQIVAFQVTHYALPLIAAGFALKFFSRRARAGHYGELALGLGLLFLGMVTMGEAMQPLRDHEPFLALMREMERPWWGIAIAALFTALIQSSSAATALIIAMAGQGLIGLHAGIALALGANIGTCVTALLASVGKPREALRAAVVHILFNVVGVAIWAWLIDPLAHLAVWLSPTVEGVAGVARQVLETPRQIANANTLFNLLNTLLFIGFTPQIARLVYRLVPEAPRSAAGLEMRARYLDDLLLATPDLALDAVRRELARIGRRVERMLTRVLPALVEGSELSLREVAAMDNVVDALQGQAIRYLGEIGRGTLTAAQTAELMRLMEAVTDLENIGDLIETNLVAQGRMRLEEGIHVSERTREVIAGVHGEVMAALREAVRAVVERDRGLAARVIARKGEVNRLLAEARSHQARRLLAHEPGRVAAYRIESDSLEQLHRIYYFAKRMARTLLPNGAGSEGGRGL